MTKFPLLAILLFIGASAFAQTHTEKEVKDLLAHKWKASHTEEGGKKMPVPPGARDWFLHLNADGTFNMVDAEGEKKGRWSYDHKTKTLTVSSEIDPSDPWKFDVIKINETELAMRLAEEGETMIAYFKRVS